MHIAAYSHLLDTIGMPESEYSAFMKYKEMKDKYDYMQNFDMSSKEDIAKTVAVFSAFTEGLQLFASFAILLNFPRHNKMKGMGQIVTWSVRDETLHCNSMIRLFKAFIKENPEIWNEKLKKELQFYVVNNHGYEEEENKDGKLKLKKVRTGARCGHGKEVTSITDKSGSTTFTIDGSPVVVSGNLNSLNTFEFDGNESLIIEGALLTLKNKNLKSILIELDKLSSEYDLTILKLSLGSFFFILGIIFFITFFDIPISSTTISPQYCLPGNK